MLAPQGLQFRAHRSARRLMCYGLGLSLLLGDSVLLLHLLAGHFHPSHDQWGLPLCVVDVKKPVVATKSSPPKKDKKSNKPSSPKVSPVHESDAYFTVKTYKEKSKGSTPVTSVKISPIQFKTYILNKERLKRSYQASDFLPDVDISPSRSELMKNKVKKVEKNIMFSEVHNQRPMADDFFGDYPQCSNSLMSH